MGRENSASDCGTDYNHSSEVGISVLIKSGLKVMVAFHCQQARDDIIGWHWIAFVD